MAILRNRCQCKLCLDIIESKHVHHFARCACGAIFTDGGLDYIRRGWTPPDVPNPPRGYDGYILSLDETTPDPEEP